MIYKVMQSPPDLNTPRPFCLWCCRPNAVEIGSSVGEGEEPKGTARAGDRASSRAFPLGTCGEEVARAWRLRLEST